MITFIKKKQPTLTYRIFSAFIAFTFIFSMVVPPQMGYAQVVPLTVLNLPVPGAMLPMSTGFTPPLITGITIHPENPLEFDFMIDVGDAQIEGDRLKNESQKLIKYFLASLTVPENELWVNLSPYEEGRIVPEIFGQTEMGRDLLAQDYLLKQLTASLMYPEDELGKKFWDRVYQKAYDLYGTTEIPMNTFNKVWIVPDQALVYEHESSAYVIESHLKVMLEEDYLALQSNMENASFGMDQLGSQDIEVVSGVTSEVIKEVLIPEIEKEVNEGETFANLRQIYNSMILATWYKKNLKESLLGQVYVNQNKTKGVDVEDKEVKQKIYDQYLEAFKKGVYNYIREDYDPVTQEIIPRKYFSGGFDGPKIGAILKEIGVDDISSLGTDTGLFIKFVKTVGKAGELSNKGVSEVILSKFEELIGYNSINRDHILGQLGVDVDEGVVGIFRVHTVLVENAKEGSEGIEVVKPVDATAVASLVSSKEVVAIKSRFKNLMSDPNVGDLAVQYSDSFQSLVDLVPFFIKTAGVSEEEILKELVRDTYANYAAQLEGISKLRKEGKIFPEAVDLRMSVSDEERESVSLPGGKRVQSLDWPMKGDPWQHGHIWMIGEAIWKLSLDKASVFADNGDPRKQELTSLAMRGAITEIILEQFFGDLVQYNRLPKEVPALLDTIGEIGHFPLLELNAQQPMDSFYGAGSDHAKLYALKKGAPLDVGDFTKSLDRIRADFEGISSELEKQLQEAEYMEGGSLAEGKFSELLVTLKDRGYLDGKGIPAKGQFREYETEGRPEDIDMNDLSQEMRTDEFRRFVYEAFFNADVAMLLADRMIAGDAGYIDRKDSQTTNVVFSERKGAEVSDELLAKYEDIVSKKLARYDLPPMKLKKIEQPINASSTDVRDLGHYWKVPFVVLQMAHAFRQWGYATEEETGKQKEQGEKGWEELVAPGLEDAAQRDLSFKAAENAFLEYGGIAMNTIDRLIMQKILENRDLIAASEGENVRAQATYDWLQKVRSLLFERAKVIAREAVNNPLPIREKDQGTMARMLTNGEMQVPKNVVEYLKKRQEQGFSMEPADIAQELKVSDELVEAIVDRASSPLEIPKGLMGLIPEEDAALKGDRMPFPEMLEVGKWLMGKHYFLEQTMKVLVGRGRLVTDKGWTAAEVGIALTRIKDQISLVNKKIEGAVSEGVPSLLEILQGLTAEEGTPLEGDLMTLPEMLEVGKRLTGELYSLEQAMKALEGRPVTDVNWVAVEAAKALTRIKGQILRVNKKIEGALPFKKEIPKGLTVAEDTALKGGFMNLMQMNKIRERLMVERDILEQRIRKREREPVGKDWTADAADKKELIDMGMGAQILRLDKGISEVFPLVVGVGAMSESLSSPVTKVDMPLGLKGLKNFADLLSPQYSKVNQGFSFLSFKVYKGDKSPRGVALRVFKLVNSEPEFIPEGHKLSLGEMTKQFADTLGLTSQEILNNGAELVMWLSDQDERKLLEDYAARIKGNYRERRGFKLFTELMKVDFLPDSMRRQAIRVFDGVSSSSDFANAKKRAETIAAEEGLVMTVEPSGNYSTIVMALSSEVQEKALKAKVEKRLKGDSGSSPVSLFPSIQKERVGGIDLNPELLDLQIKRDGNGIPLPVAQQPIYNMKIEGFLPVIINITPVAVSPLLLGILQETEADNDLSYQPDFESALKVERFALREVATEEVIS